MFGISRGIDHDIASLIDDCHDIENNHTSTLDELCNALNSDETFGEALNEKLSRIIIQHCVEPKSKDRIKEMRNKYSVSEN